jgi:Fe-S-cluster containining protein
LLNEEMEILLQQGLPPTLITADKRIRAVPFKKENTVICSLFNTEDNRCKIYAFRPLECQLYPFLINRKDKKYFLAVDLNCAYVQKRQGTPEFKEYVLYLADLFKSPHYSEILKNNPQLIQEYTQVSNLCEL